MFPEEAKARQSAAGGVGPHERRSLPTEKREPIDGRKRDRHERDTGMELRARLCPFPRPAVRLERAADTFAANPTPIPKNPASLRPVFDHRVPHLLPLHVGRFVVSAVLQRVAVIDNVTRASAAGGTG